MPDGEQPGVGGISELDARRLVERWFGIWGEGGINVVDEVCTDPYLRHTSIGSESISLEQYKKKLVQTRAARRWRWNA